MIEQNEPNVMFGEHATRADHIRTCKKRALEYLDIGDCCQAVASMMSDLGKHPETEGIVSMMAPLGLLSVTSEHECRRFIEGFAL